MTVEANPTPAARASDELICHCRQVTYDTVRSAVRDARVASLAEVQRETTACTRCFGCRFEVEGVLRDELGERYVPAVVVTRDPSADDRATLRTRLRARVRGVRERVNTLPPQKMYMPVLQGFAGHDVSTRL